MTHGQAARTDHIDSTCPPEMPRRTFMTIIGTVAGGLLAAPLVARAQPAAPPPGRLWRVGILFQADTGRGGPYLEAIRQGFRDLGYVEGRAVPAREGHGVPAAPA